MPASAKPKQCHHSIALALKWRGEPNVQQPCNTMDPLQQQWIALAYEMRCWPYNVGSGLAAASFDMAPCLCTNCAWHSRLWSTPTDEEHQHTTIEITSSLSQVNPVAMWKGTWLFSYLGTSAQACEGHQFQQKTRVGKGLAAACLVPGPVNALHPNRYIAESSGTHR